MRSPAREMRKHLMVMIVSVLVLDAIAIGIYYLAEIRAAAPTVQYGFVGVWTVATLLIVLRGTGRVRAARVRGRQMGG